MGVTALTSGLTKYLLSEKLKEAFLFMSSATCLKK